MGFFIVLFLYFYSIEILFSFEAEQKRQNTVLHVGFLLFLGYFFVDESTIMNLESGPNKTKSEQYEGNCSEENHYIYLQTPRLYSLLIRKSHTGMHHSC